MWPRFIRVTNAPVGDFLHIAEVEVYDSHSINVALGRSCTSSSVYDDCGGSTAAGCGCGNVVDGEFVRPRDIFHSGSRIPGEYVQVDLGSPTAVARVVIRNRNDAAWERLAGQTVLALDEERRVLWSATLAGDQAPQAFTLGPEVACPSATASATATASKGAPPSMSPLPPSSASASESVARSASPSPWSSEQRVAAHAAAHAAAWRGRTWPVMAAPRGGDGVDECEAACTSALACAAAANASLARAPAAAGARGALYLWAISTAHVPLMYNLLESAFYYTPESLHGILLAALSPGVYAAARAYNVVARARGAPCIYFFDASAHIRDPTVRAGADAHNTSQWGDATFLSAAWARPVIALELITAGFTVFSMDVDMVMFRDLRAAWPAAAELNFIPTACDSLDDSLGVYNTGAMLLAHAQHVRAVNNWVAGCSNHCRSQKTEQAAFQELPEPLKSACVSPEILNHICIRRPPDPLTNAAYHFACHVNAPQKARTMASFGLWFLHCDASTALRGGEDAWRECVPLAQPSARGEP